MLDSLHSGTSVRQSDILCTPLKGLVLAVCIMLSSAAGSCSSCATLVEKVCNYTPARSQLIATLHT